MFKENLLKAGLLLSLLSVAPAQAIPLSPEQLGFSQKALAQVAMEEALRVPSQETPAWLLSDTKLAKALRENALRPQAPRPPLWDQLIASVQLFERVIHPRFRSLLPAEALSRGGPRITLIFGDLPEAMGHSSLVPRLGAGTALLINLRTIGRPEFAASVAHELQHAYNNHFSGNTLEEDWLNEGLSQFVESWLTRQSQDRLLNGLLGAGQTAPLLEWQEQAPYPNFATSYLFVAYLFHHFGGEALLGRLITAPEVGLASVEKQLQELAPQTPDIPDTLRRFPSVFLNFSVALVLNSRAVGQHAMFSLSGAQFEPELLRLRMQPAFQAAPQWATELAPFQSSYRIWAHAPGCIRISRDDATLSLYLIRRQGNTVLSIQKVDDTLCREAAPDAPDLEDWVLLATRTGGEPGTKAGIRVDRSADMR